MTRPDQAGGRPQPRADMRHLVAGLSRLIGSLARSPIATLHQLSSITYDLSARRFTNALDRSGGAGRPSRVASSDSLDGPNPLEAHFRSNRTGPGIWKWTHYFEAYHRHLRKFIGKAPKLVEIGVYSGGSLDMWQRYFGDGAQIIGVDIEPACRAYERPGVEIVIGDQGDRSFWQSFIAQHGEIDIVIDDGGHTPPQQRATLEEVLPALNRGGVYICEDIHGSHNRFTSYAATLATGLNGFLTGSEEGLHCYCSEFQSLVHSMHFYPFLLAIERTGVFRERLDAPRMGSEWQPFYEKDRDAPAQ